MMTSEQPQSLLILGNGADLYQKYPYTYQDFFKNQYSQLCEPNSLNIKKEFHDILNQVVTYFVRNADFVRNIKDLTSEQEGLAEQLSNDIQEKMEGYPYAFCKFSILDLIFLDPKLITDNTRISNLPDENSNWTDIESVIRICSQNLDKSVPNDDFVIAFTALSKTLQVINCDDDKKTSLIELLMAPEANETELINASFECKSNPATLYDSINDIEAKFMLYLNENPKVKYNERGDVQQKRARLKNVFPANPNKTTVLNFNYTNLDFDYSDSGFDQSSSTIHPHGSLNAKRIIFGINSTNNGNPLSSKNTGFQLTKTFRGLLERAVNSSDAIVTLPTEMEEIIFFGHSLNESDYDYFYSIFDAYNLYSSRVRLTFYYALHGDVDPSKDGEKDADYELRCKQQIQDEQVFPITKLINSYGESMNNSDHGNNLLHRLLLEGRIRVLNIDTV